MTFSPEKDTKNVLSAFYSFLQTFAAATGFIYIALLPAFYDRTNPDTRFAIRWNWPDFFSILVAILIPAVLLAILLAFLRRFLRKHPWISALAALVPIYIILRSIRMMGRASGLSLFLPGTFLGGLPGRLLYLLVPLAVLLLARRKTPLISLAISYFGTILAVIFFVTALFYPRFSATPPIPPPIKPLSQGVVPPPHFLLVIFDECSADRVRPDGLLRSDLPHLHEFEKEAQTYLNVYSEGTETPISLPRLLAIDPLLLHGSYAEQCRQAAFGGLKDAPTLFSLATNHYRSVTGVHLDYDLWMGDTLEDVRTFLIISVMSFPERVIQTWLRAFPAGRHIVHRPIVGETEGFVAAVQGSIKRLPGLISQMQTAPVAALWHIPLPHYPFVWDVDGLQPDLAHRPIHAVMTDPDGYTANLRYMDTILGLLVARLKDAGLWDSTLLVVTSDHGWRLDPAISPDECRYPIEDLDPSSPYRRIPFWVKYPGSRHAGEHIDAAGCHARPLLWDIVSNELSLQTNSLPIPCNSL